MHPFPHPLRIALCPQQVYLIGEPRDVAGELEELVHELLGEPLEFGVVAVVGVIFAAGGCGLGF